MQGPRRVGFVDESYGTDDDGCLIHVLGLRARAVGLSTIAWAKGADLDLLVIESREARLDGDDAAVLAKTHPPAAFRVRFLSKWDDPILWAADIVASATFQALARGVPDHRDALRQVEQYDC